MAVTKAEEVYTKTEALVEGGMSKADAFKKLAEEYGQPVNSIRGSYYSHTKGNGTSRPRKRETTPADAVEQATATLYRAIEAIDKEITAAEERATEATAEAKALKASAAERKAEIETKIKALEA